VLCRGAGEEEVIPGRVRSKLLALGMLAVLSIAGPIAEATATGRIDSMGKFDLAETFIAITLVYWWYHADKAEHDYRAGPLMNGGVIVLALLALPIYFVRTRGWRKGALASLAALAFLGFTLGLEALGEWIGGALL
jgi:steroid 5-alpha reductase family enzyme